MKTDEIPFTFVTAIVLAGALLAVLSPTKPETTGVPALSAAIVHAVATSTDASPLGEPATATEVEIAE